MDLYLADFKYGNDRCGKELSGVEDYFEWSRGIILRQNRQCEMIIRHWCFRDISSACSKPVLDWISDKLDNSNVRVNIMDQYRPEYIIPATKGLPRPGQETSPERMAEGHTTTAGTLGSILYKMGLCPKFLIIDFKYCKTSFI